MLMVPPKNLEQALQPLSDFRPPEVEYNGFPFWHGLLVEPNREERSARWLDENIGIEVYWPRFRKQCPRRGARAHHHRACSVTPGMIFAPIEFLAIPRRDDVFEYAHIRGLLPGTAGAAARLTKANIEIIREIEAKLNLPPPVKGVVNIRKGQRVRFLDPLYDEFWGIGTVFEVAGEGRIGVEVKKLIGRVYTPASEIEVL